jgi:hypothetical protein
MSIACMLGGTGERRTKTRARHDPPLTSIPMDGNANGCPTFQKLLLTVAPGGPWQANRSSMKPFAIGAARLAALGYFTVTGCIPQPWLASTGPRGYRQNQSKYQSATDRSRPAMGSVMHKSFTLQASAWAVADMIQ